MRLKKILHPLGQAAIEYLLMIVLSIGMGTAFTKKFKALFLDNPDSFLGGQMKVFKRMFDPQAGYKKYRLPK